MGNLLSQIRPHQQISGACFAPVGYADRGGAFQVTVYLIDRWIGRSSYPRQRYIIQDLIIGKVKPLPLLMSVHKEALFWRQPKNQETRGLNMDVAQVLLVDDDPVLLQALPQMIALRMHGVQVKTT